jgi:hypothetical protein
MRATKLSAALLLFLALSLAGCARIEALRQPVGRASGLTPTAVTPVVATQTPSSSAAPTDAPTDVATDVPTTVPATSTPKAAPSPTTAAPSKATPANDAAIAAIKAVVERANQEQVDAFTKKDPTIMRDTATTSYYEQLQQTNRDLADNGVDTIKLAKIEWGPITLNGTTGATATTFETWDTSYVDGNSDESRDRNVYTLVLDNGSWKIQDDTHPDSGLDTPPSDIQPVSSPQPPQPLPSNLAPNASSSRNWSGYVASKGTYTSVTGTWIVPQPSASRTTSAGATWVGIGGAKNHDLIQAGTEESVAGANGVRYSAWIEMLPAASHTVPLKVNPGDSVTVTITQQSKDNWLITLKNDTTGKSYEAKENYQSSLSSAEWIEEAPSGGRRVYPLDNFGTVSFSNGSAVVDGKTVSIAATGARAVSMTGSTGRIIAAPSKLGSDGKSFTVTRTDALPTANSKQFDGLFSFDPRNLLKADVGLGSVGAAGILSVGSSGVDLAQP